MVLLHDSEGQKELTQAFDQLGKSNCVFIMNKEALKDDLLSLSVSQHRCTDLSQVTFRKKRRVKLMKKLLKAPKQFECILKWTAKPRARGKIAIHVALIANQIITSQ